MSRALDNDTKDALTNGDHGKVYGELCDILAQRFDELLEIEILGSSHPLEPHINFLQDGNAVAIPKLRLVQAFIFARRKFREESSRTDPNLKEACLQPTAIMLLMDGEHLTAANARKRVLKREMATNEKEAHRLLAQEKYFIDSLLTSRLHRHTKSPTLWSHRRWLIDRLRALQLPLDVAEDLRKVVFVSGERHPRNYYAWCHARYLISADGTDSPALSTILEDTKRWCFTHHDDISGWAFLLFLLEKSKWQARGILNETTKLTKSFYWRNESVWYFLRNLALRGCAGEEAPGDLRSVLEFVRNGADADDQRTLDGTAVWVEDCSS